MSAAKSVVTRVAIQPACADIGKRAHLGMATGFHSRPVPSGAASVSSSPSGEASVASVERLASPSSPSCEASSTSTEGVGSLSSPSDEASFTSAEEVGLPSSASGRGWASRAEESWSEPKAGSSGISESERVLSSTRSVYRGPCSTGVAHPKVRRLTRE